MKTYFLLNNVNSLIKIGKSKDVYSRMREIKGQCSFIELSIFHIVEGNYESFFHKYYSDLRVTGEWFDLKGITIEELDNALSFKRGDLNRSEKLYKWLVEHEYIKIGTLCRMVDTDTANFYKNKREGGLIRGATLDKIEVILSDYGYII